MLHKLYSLLYPYLALKKSLRHYGEQFVIPQNLTTVRRFRLDFDRRLPCLDKQLKREEAMFEIMLLAESLGLN